MHTLIQALGWLVFQVFFYDFHRQTWVQPWKVNCYVCTMELGFKSTSASLHNLFQLTSLLQRNVRPEEQIETQQYCLEADLFSITSKDRWMSVQEKQFWLNDKKAFLETGTVQLLDCLLQKAAVSTQAIKFRVGECLIGKLGELFPSILRFSDSLKYFDFDFNTIRVFICFSPFPQVTPTSLRIYFRCFLLQLPVFGTTERTPPNPFPPVRQAGTVQTSK